jgi:hypothetical protein
VSWTGWYGQRALLPAFEALDADGDGTISQEQLVSMIDAFCSSRPDAEGCDVPERPMRLAEAFSAFAGGAERLLDYERFVEMVSGRDDGFGEECEIVQVDAEEEAAKKAAKAARTAAYLAEEVARHHRRHTAAARHPHLAASPRHASLAAWPLRPITTPRSQPPHRARTLRSRALATPCSPCATSTYKHDLYLPCAHPYQPIVSRWQGELMGERECFGEAITDTGDDDPACDAWFFGEDPNDKSTKQPVDQAKIDALRAAGEAQQHERKQREEAMAALLAGKRFPLSSTSEGAQVD